MDITVLISQLFLLFYAVILGLVAPWVGFSNKSVGSFVPFAIAVLWASVLSTSLVLLSIGYDNPWNLLSVMLTMPLAMWLGTKFLGSKT